MCVYTCVSVHLCMCVPLYVCSLGLCVYACVLLCVEGVMYTCLCMCGTVSAIGRGNKTCKN